MKTVFSNINVWDGEASKLDAVSVVVTDDLITDISAAPIDLGVSRMIQLTGPA